jgi:phage tail sheath gpL-like
VGQTPTTAQYTDALSLLAQREDVELVICDSPLAEVHALLRDHVDSCAQARRERIAVVAAAAGETVAQLVSRAAELNSERMVLLSPCPTDSDGTVHESGIAAAAAAAGAIAAESDPAVPLGGAVLQGLGGLETSYADGELDTLIRGGVTPLESVGGQVSVIRGITTRTTTGGSADTTWRELTTILVVDNVIPAIRNALRAKFLRTKNTAQTRSAISSQVVILLEDKVSREIIDGYDSVTVTADSEDPTRCLVSFNFTVAHGLNQIYITAHITV